MAYNMPAAKVADTPSFFWMGNFRCQMVQSGRSRIRRSDVALIVPVTIRLRFALMHLPWMVASHAFGTGLHWKMTDSKLAE